MSLLGAGEFRFDLLEGHSRWDDGEALVGRHGWGCDALREARRLERSDGSGSGTNEEGEWGGRERMSGKGGAGNG